MLELFQLIVAGLATGAIYALAAVGFVLLWQTSHTINFAQGEFVMLPAVFVLIATKFGGGAPLWVAILIAVAATLLLLGVVFKFAIVDPLIPHGVLPLVIATIAVALLMRDGVREFYSAEAHSFPHLVPDGFINIWGIVVSAAEIGILVVALVAIAALQLFLNRTRTGRAMQATAQNPSVARILGIPVDRMILYTFLINAGLAAIASILVSPIYLVKFSNGEVLGLVAFTAAIVGGFNQIRGAIVGGLLIGVVDNLSAIYFSTAYRQAFPLILLILIIIFRPQGLLGRREERTI